MKEAESITKCHRRRGWGSGDMLLGVWTRDSGAGVCSPSSCCRPAPSESLENPVPLLTLLFAGNSLGVSVTPTSAFVTTRLPSSRTSAPLLTRIAVTPRPTLLPHDSPPGISVIALCSNRTTRLKTGGWSSHNKRNGRPLADSVLRSRGEARGVE